MLLCQLFEYGRVSQTANKHVVMKSSWARYHAPKVPDAVSPEAERSLKTMNSKSCQTCKQASKQLNKQKTLLNWEAVYLYHLNFL